MNSKQIYHLTHGQGSILDYSEGIYTINFDTGDIKKFSDIIIGKYLFLNKSDYDIAVQLKNSKHSSEDSNTLKLKESEEQTTENNNHYNVDTISSQYTKMLQPGNFSNLSNPYTNNFVLPDISSEPFRNIVIVLNNIVTLKDKKYLNFIGIDVFTGIVVKIVDTNGSIYGYHSYNSDLYKIKPYTVINAQFTNYNSNKELNIIQLKSPIKILGESNLSELDNKYKYITSKYNVSFHTFVYNFKYIQQLYMCYKNKHLNVITLFENELIEKHDDKYQLLIDNISIDIVNPNADIILNKPGFCGYVLLNINCCFDKPQITGYLLSGKFIYEAELNYMKKNKGSDYCFSPYYSDWEENKYELYPWDEEEIAYAECDDSYFYDVKEEYYNDYTYFEDESEGY